MFSRLSPFLAGALIVAMPLTSAAQSRKVVFYNGQILTMDPRQPQVEALAIQGNTIVLAGDNQQVMQSGGSQVQFVDLQGRTVVPGFVDPHNHAYVSIWRGDERVGSTYNEAQELLLENGYTAIAEPGAWGGLFADYFAQISSTRLRTSFYFMYDNQCGNVFGHWYFAFPTFPTADPDLMVRVPGIKFFNDGGSCNFPAVSIPGSSPPAYEGDLYFDAPTLAAAMGEVQDAGYQTVTHAVGDVAVDVALDALAQVIGDGSNDYRHRIDHAFLLRPDQLARFGQLGVAPSIPLYPDTCDRLEPGALVTLARRPWFMPWRALLDANPGLPISWHSHIGGGNDPPLSPMIHLWAGVTRGSIGDDGTVCEAPDWMADDAITAAEGLRMMTINAARAIRMDQKIGSIRSGKYADLVILDDNPLTVPPEQIKDISVVMTMVGGKVEHCLGGYEDLCVGTVP